MVLKEVRPNFGVAQKLPVALNSLFVTPRVVFAFYMMYGLANIKPAVLSAMLHTSGNKPMPHRYRTILAEMLARPSAPS